MDSKVFATGDYVELWHLGVKMGACVLAEGDAKKEN
jgi:hypothetical protein